MQLSKELEPSRWQITKFCPYRQDICWASIESHQESTLKHSLVEAAWNILTHYRDDMGKEIWMLRPAWLRQSWEGQCLSLWLPCFGLSWLTRPFSTMTVSPNGIQNNWLTRLIQFPFVKLQSHLPSWDSSHRTWISLVCFLMFVEKLLSYLHR